MTAAEVVERAGRLGVRLWVEAGVLMYDGPSRAAVAVLRLDDHAEAIIALLLEHAPVPTAYDVVQRAAALIDVEALRR